MTRIKTLRAAHTFEIDKIKGSRFVGWALPIADEQAAASALAEVARRHRDASHHAFAWRLGPRVAGECGPPGQVGQVGQVGPGGPGGPERWRAGDAGEPAGSAGRPILREIDGRKLLGALVIVTRWYGGTKLGVGGLMRAYGGAAAAVLEDAPIVERLLVRRVLVEHPYECSGAVASLLNALGLEPERAIYGSGVSFELDVPLEALERFEADLIERTAARATVRTLDGRGGQT